MPWGDTEHLCSWPCPSSPVDQAAKAHLWHPRQVNNLSSDFGKLLPASSRGSLFVFSPGFS